MIHYVIMRAGYTLTTEWKQLRGIDYLFLKQIENKRQKLENTLIGKSMLALTS